MMGRAQIVVIPLALLTACCEKEPIPVQVEQAEGGDILIKLEDGSHHNQCINFLTVWGHADLQAPASENLLSDLYPLEPCLQEVRLIKKGGEISSLQSSITIEHRTFISIDLKTSNGNPGESAVLEIDPNDDLKP